MGGSAAPRRRDFAGRSGAGVLVSGLVGLVLLAPAAGTAGADPRVMPVAITVTGLGAGDGMGLPVDGAVALAGQGRSAQEVLAAFFPGTSLQRRAARDVAVPVWTAGRVDDAVDVTLPGGGTVRGVGTQRFTVARGGRVRVGMQAGEPAVTLVPPAVGRRGGSVPLAGVGGQSDPGTAATADPTPSEPPPSEPPPSEPSPSVPPHAEPSASVPPRAEPSASVPPRSAPAPSEPPRSGVETGASSSSSSGAAPSPSAASPAATPGGPAGPAASPAGPAGRSGASPWVATGGSATARITGDGVVIEPAGGGLALSGGVASRGPLTIERDGTGVRLLAVVDVEDQLRGLAELRDPGLPAAARVALAVAARTTSLRAAEDPRTGSHTPVAPELGDWLGLLPALPALEEALATSRGTVLTWQDELAVTPTCADGAGRTAGPAEALGMPGPEPAYLAGAPYLAPSRPGWARRVTLADAATALDYPGRLTAVEVTARGPSGRVTAVRLAGSAGTDIRRGTAVAAALSLPSTLFDTGAGLRLPGAGTPGGPTLPGGDALAAARLELPPLLPVDAALGGAGVPEPLLAAATVSAVRSGGPAGSPGVPAGSGGPLEWSLPAPAAEVALASVHAEPGPWWSQPAFGSAAVAAAGGVALLLAAGLQRRPSRRPAARVEPARPTVHEAAAALRLAAAALRTT